MSKHRQIDTRFWEDFYISQLDPVEKLLFLYFILNSRTGLCGAYEVPLSIVAGETGIDRDMVRKIVDRFDSENKIKYVNGFVIIKNYTKYLQLNPSILIGIKREESQLPDSIKNELKNFSTQALDSLYTETTQDVYIPKPKPKPKLLTKIYSKFFSDIVEKYNFANGTQRRKIAKGTQENIVYWLDFHTEEEILKAIENQPNCTIEFYRTIDFDTIFRKSNKNREPVDYLEGILKNYKSNGYQNETE